MKHGPRTLFAVAALLFVSSMWFRPVRVGATGPEGHGGAGLPPLTALQVRTLRAITSAAEQDGHVFAKVGDSMTESRAYLRCLGGDDVELGGRDALQATIDHFRVGDAGGTDPFRRASAAARVGWSTNDVLRGRPSPLRRELSLLRPRYATLMLGTNEVASRAPRRYARRMWTILEELETRGVVPLVSTIPPRTTRPTEDDWARRYNLIVKALSEGRGLPALDLYRELSPLPNRGMARDGIHTNVYVRRGRARPCDFRAEGLRYGHNLRNLRTLQHLDRLRRTVESARDSVSGDVRPMAKPAVEREHVAAFPFAAVRAWDGSGVVSVFELEVSRRTQLRALAIARTGRPLRLQLVGSDRRAARTQLEQTIGPGRHRLRIEGAERPPTEVLITIDAALPASIADNPFQ